MKKLPERGSPEFEKVRAQMRAERRKRFDVATKRQELAPMAPDGTILS